MIYEFNGYKPVIHETAFIHPQATVTGNVIIGKNVYVGPGAAIRGDWGKIIIEDGCNVQENCTIHMFPGTTTLLKESAHIGHGAIIHGATIGKNVLVGMNAVIMDNVEIGDNCLIGSLCFVPGEMKIPERKMVVGNPARILKEMSNEMIEWKTQGTRLYQQLPAECKASLKECEPLREIEPNRTSQQDVYKTWKNIKLDEKNKLKFLTIEFPQYLSTLKANKKGNWGVMNAQQMVEHFTESVSFATGKNNQQLHTLREVLPRFREFALSEKEFKPNTMNALLSEQPSPERNATMQDAIAELQNELNDFVEYFKKNKNAKLMNAFFGELNFEEWTHLLHKHAIHHCKQFGLL